MNCSTCGGEFVSKSWMSSTLVGYSSPPGHNHDDNCRNVTYTCEKGHTTNVSKRQRCSNDDCDWVGRESCFCHKDGKVDEWPDSTKSVSVV